MYHADIVFFSIQLQFDALNDHTCVHWSKNIIEKELTDLSKSFALLSSFFVQYELRLNTKELSLRKLLILLD